MCPLGPLLLHSHIYAYLPACMFVYVYYVPNVYVCMHVCMHVFIYVYMYIK